MEATDLRRRDGVEGAAERKELELPTVGEYFGKNPVVDGDVTCEVDVREVADGEIGCGYWPVLVIERYGSQKVVVFCQKVLDLYGSSAYSHIREMSEALKSKEANVSGPVGRS